MIEKIISGGQTGVDRAALDAAMAVGLEVGGWCPRGRRAEDGRIPDRYPLIEMSSSAYDVRTRMNVLRSDATLLLTRGDKTQGSTTTAWTCFTHNKKLVELGLEEVTDFAYEYVCQRLEGIKILNVAGPRESIRPGIYQQAHDFLVVVLKRLKS